MGLRRFSVLFKKEFVTGSKSFIFIWAIIAPLVLTFVMSLLFGVFLIRTPKLGLYMESASAVLEETQKTKAIVTKEYESVEELKNAVSQGIIDVGIVIPVGFDDALKEGTKTSLQAFVFGESYAKNRAIVVTTFGNIVRGISGKEIPIEVESITVSEPGAIPVAERMFPFIVLVSIFFGGLFIPATSLVTEKRRKTMDAIRISSSTMNEIMSAKISLGALVSLFTGILTLLLNRSFGIYPFHLLLVMVVGVFMAAFIGTLLGIYINDFATLLSFWKIGGIVLFFPAIVYIFPQIPKIISRFFPTYYILEPIIELTKGSADLRIVWTNIIIGIIIDIVLGTIVFTISKRVEKQGFPALAGK